MVRRTWRKCNIPMFVLFIVIVYWAFTARMLADHVIWGVRQRDVAAHATTRLTTSLPNGRLNGPATVLWLIGLPNLAATIGWVPDMLISLFLGGMTLWALYLGSLSDPGPIPKAFYVGPKPPQRHTAAAAGDTGVPSDVDIRCVNVPGSPPTPSQLLGVAGGGGGGATVPFGFPKTRSDPLYCEFCQRSRPPRSHHCRRCGQCVVRYDHHCDWIDNCVGKANHKCFLLFIGYISTCIMHFYTMAGRVLFLGFPSLHILTPIGPGPQPLPPFTSVMELVFLCMYAFIVFPCSLFAAIFLCTSLWQLLWNQTTYDTATTQSGKKSPYDRGMMRNCREVLGENILMWLVPSLVTVNDEPASSEHAAGWSPAMAV